MLGLDFDRLSAATESMGYRSSSFIGNSATYIMFAIIAVGMNIIVIFLLLGCRKRLKGPIVKKLEEFKKESFSFNPKIKSLHIIYLESCISY